MVLEVLKASAVSSLLITIFFIFIMGYLRSLHPFRAVKKATGVDLTGTSTETAIRLSNSLASALPGSVILPSNTAAFERSMNSYWAQQECEVIPACVVRPRDVQQLCTAVTILKREYDHRKEDWPEGLFAIRSGGHCPVPGAASTEGGVMIDLSLFDEVTPIEGESKVILGTGAKWKHVYHVLEEKGLAISGCRDSEVGVGGMILGGGLTFFSPRFGLVCSSVLSYEIVLANGSLTTASASGNPDLWRALKGGSNNFGIVTRMTVPIFPSTKIWSGFLYMPSSQATKVLMAFHESVQSADSGGLDSRYNSNVAGPIACFTHLQQIGIQAVSVNLAFTKPPENEGKWPDWWNSSRFKSIWRFWSTCKVHTLTSAADELNALNPPGRRQLFASTTIKNDPATLTATHIAYQDAIASIRSVNAKGMSWTLTMQPLLSAWLRKGDANPLGLEDCTEALVLVSFTVNWHERRDDEFVNQTTRKAVEQIDAFAAVHDTGHRFRYVNYCAKWQKPFESYGEKNLRFLHETSRKYDPEGLFQWGCVGGFKLGLMKPAR